MASSGVGFLRDLSCKALQLRREAAEMGGIGLFELLIVGGLLGVIGLGALAVLVAVFVKKK